MTTAAPNLEFDGRLQVYRSDIVARFDRLCIGGRVAGEIDGQVWKFASRALRFSSAKSKLHPIEGPLGVVARGFIVESIEMGLGQEAVYGRLQAVRLLFDHLGDSCARFIALSKVDFNAVVALIKSGRSVTTAYNRANALSVFCEYIDSIRVGKGSSASSLLGRRIAWKSKLKNPIRSTVAKGIEGGIGEKGKYLDSLHIAVGRARSLVRSDPSLEPSPGYDSMRLEPLAFMMATGLRIGELCALSVDCLGTEESSGSLFVRVPTEKGALPSARPISEVWGESVNEAYDYLLEQCREPRLRAREIERNGFSFIGNRLELHRREVGIDDAFSAQLYAAELDLGRHFRVDEVVEALGLSEKELGQDGRFREALAPLPRIAASRLVRWVDQRMDRWDWHMHAMIGSDARTGQSGIKYLSASAIAEKIGGGRSNLAKADWMFEELRRFLIILSQCGAIENGDVDEHKKARIAEEWRVLRALALSRVGGGQCTAVDAVKLQQICAERFSAYLSQHFRELCSISSDGSLKIGGMREGVPEKLSEHLLVVWDNSFSGTKGRGLIPRPMFQSDFYSYLCTNSQKTTVFQRLGINDKSGKPFSATPHQLRHWVTTAVFRSGPSETMVDLWMGRSTGQSRIYDHRTARERAEAFRERYLSTEPPSDHLGKQVRFWREVGLDSKSIEDHLRSKMRIMHFVPTGACSRELFLSPCTRGLMCLKGFGTSSVCPSFHIDTKDEQARLQISALREKHAAMLRSLYPTQRDLADVMMEELNSSESLDQHIIHIVEVIRGCDQALDAYQKAKDAHPSGGRIFLKVIE